MSPWPIAIAGNINLDIRTSPLAAREGVLSDGETAVEEIYESLGGGGANTALAAAHLGACVHFFGCTGCDDLGSRLEAALIACGITPHLARNNTATGHSIALHWNNGHRHFLSSLPNNRAMTLDDIDVGALLASGCRQLLRADVWFSDAMLFEGNHELLRRAKAAGLETYIDINWDPEWSVPGNGSRVEQRLAALRRVLPFVDYAHGNERELASFAGREEIREGCRVLTDGGCGSVIVHQGARGAAAWSGAEGWTEVPAVPVERVICPTGCGDVFCAAHMLHRHLKTRERLAACVSLASAHLSGKRILIPRLASGKENDP